MLRALGVADWAGMVRVADREPERFHQALLRETGFRFFRPYTRVVDESAGIEWVRWCAGGTTNATLNALDRWRGTPTWDKPAVIWEGENGDRRSLTYRELDREVCRLAGGLRSLGLRRGDVVAVCMPNVPEAFVAMLAIPKIGCIAMPLFSGFGAEAIATRVALGEARVLITVDASPRRGRMVNAKAIVDEALPGKHVDVDDNLFEVGVSSLTLTEIALAVDERYPGQVDIADIFDHPTLREIAEFMRRNNH